MYRRYVKESEANRDNAEVLKETRLAAIVLGFSKTDVRLIEPDFKDRYLDRKLPEEMKPQTAAPTSVAIPGLNRSMKPAAPKVAQAKALTDTVLKAKAVETAEDGQLTERAKNATETFSAARRAVEDALEPQARMPGSASGNRPRRTGSQMPARILNSASLTLGWPRPPAA